MAQTGKRLATVPAGLATEGSPAEEVERIALEALDAGDRRHALTVLMRAHGDAIFRYCLHILGDAELARDACQITFVQAFEGFDRFSRGASLRTWLFAIARHRCLDLIKGRRRFRSRFVLTDAVPEPRDVARESPDRHGLDARSIAVLARCLDKLRPEVRMTILLRYKDGLSYPEIAEIMGRRPTTLQSRVARALPGLRRCVEANGVEL